MRETTRRRLLEGIAFTGAIAVAGCIDAVDLDDGPDGSATESEGGSDATDDSETESVDTANGDSTGGSETESDEPRPLYERWLPARATDTDVEFLQFDHTAFRETEDHLPDDVHSFVTDAFEPLTELEVDLENVEASLVYGHAHVLIGSFETATVESTVDGVAETVVEHGSHTIYDGVSTDSITDGTVAIGPDSIIVHSGDLELSHRRPPDGNEVETLLETADGTRERLLETDADASPLLELVDGSDAPEDEDTDAEDSVSGGSSILICALFDGPQDNVAGAIGAGASWRFDAETTHQKIGLVYNSEDSVDPDGVESEAREIGFADDDAAVSQTGRIGTLSSSVSTSELDLFEAESGSSTAPAAGVSVDVDSSADEATVVLITAGRLDSLRILVDDEVQKEVETPSVGDSFLVDAEDGTEIVIVGTYDGDEAVLSSMEA